MTLSLPLLLERLAYSPDTGVFVWKIGARAGKRAGSIDKQAGYEQIGICGKLYRSHRIAWMYMHGAMPEDQIDHINGNRSDNRIANLRAASDEINNQNRRRANKNNATGLLGAHAPGKRNSRYSASIMKNRKMKHLGYFDSAEEAHAAHVAARREMFVGNTL